MAQVIDCTHQGVAQGTGPQALAELLPWLRRLDTLLERAVAAARSAYGPEATVDPFRGLHIGEREVARLLDRPPCEPALVVKDGEDPAPGATGPSRLARLAQTFGLVAFEVDVLLIALAPELDRRYERLYAYLQDHVGRRRPAVDLALDLLCPDAAARLARRAHFDPAAPLIRHALIHLLPEPGGDQPSLLAHSVRPDEQIVRFLLGQDGLDARLAPACRVVGPARASGAPAAEPLPEPGLLELVRRSLLERRPLRLCFHGPAGAGKRAAAEALAGAARAPLLTVDLARLLDAGADFPELLGLVFRYAALYGAIPYLDGFGLLCGDDPPRARQQLQDALARYAGACIVAGAQPCLGARAEPVRLLPVPFAALDFARRRDCWRRSLGEAGAALDGPLVDALAARFRLGPWQIAAAAELACQRAYVRAAAKPEEGRAPTRDELFAAARAQSGHRLAALAQKIEPAAGWDDIVLPEDTLAQLRELCAWVAGRERVLGAWGFGRKLSTGRGVCALFAGPSGTGKTMAAEVVAGELGLDLYRVDLAGVVSKYIGETEQNLERLFTAAEATDAILLFDEADALFGKRSAVRDSHDRYANLEVSYLLQRIERYDGLAILATNLRQNLDEAFLRRIAFSVSFPFPDPASRARIWAGVWPPETPLAADLNLPALAQEHRLSGGNIRNIALAAAYLAAAEGGAVTMAHLRRATRREYQKLGVAREVAAPDGAAATPGAPAEAHP